MSEARPSRGRPVALVTDDDKLIRTLVRQSLTAIGFEVEEACNGREALEVAERASPALVILDLVMPEMGGLEACKALRRTAFGGEVPVLILTGMAERDTVQELFDAGANELIRKPVDWPEFRHRVQNMVADAEARAKLRETRTHLVEAGRRLANVERLAHVGSWEWKPELGEARYSEEVSDMIRTELSGGPTTPEALFELVHPEDRAALLEVAQQPGPWELKVRIQLQGGALLRVLVAGEREDDRVFGIVRRVE